MLVMRKEQMAALKQLAQHGFEAEMLDHLAGFSPRLFKLAGKEAMQRAISFGIERAKSYGFDLRGPVRLYLELMVLFGSHFDTDPQYPWAAEILADAKSASVPQAQRAERLYMKAVECRQMIAGPNEAYVLKASRKIAQIIRHSPELPPDDFTSEMLRLAKSVHPEKADYVGDGVLETLIRKGMDAARTQGLSNARGASLLFMLLLAFGHGCDADPFYPWIRRSRENGVAEEPETMEIRLKTTALSWLDYLLA